jgi:hypothetical protein
MKTFETFGKFCFGVLAIIITSLLGGYVFMTLWQWFIVYAFSVQPINLIQAIGLMFFWRYLNPKKKDDVEMTWGKFTEMIIETLLWFGVVLGLGYLITLFQ